MRLFLAPMEGVVDHTMRALITRIGGVDRCVTEFVRVTEQLLPPRVFHRYCPELKNGGFTPAGVPVYLQLLGGQAEAMAANARRAADLGAPGIDLNFGCPAKQVNRSDGGSVLLREPDRVFAISRAVRQAVPFDIPVTVKIRLGYMDTSPFREVVAAVIESGASELSVHARTRSQGYRPPAYWNEIAAVSESSPIPIIANGEIWSPEDYRRCIRQSGCADVMLGRGLLACPDLARQIKRTGSSQPSGAMPWSEVVDLILYFGQLTEAMYEARYVGNRTKQWLGYLRRHYPLANDLFESVKRLRRPSEIAQALSDHKRRLADGAAVQPIDQRSCA